MQTLQDELRDRLALAPQQYHRLIIILNPDTQIKIPTFNKVAGDLEMGCVNLGLELSQMLLDLTERQRALRLPQLVEQIIARFEGKPVLLEHIEILFEPDLKQDPLRLLQGLSRNRVIVAMWNGQISNGNLTYAVPEHPEYRRYPIKDLNILSLLDYTA